METILAKYIPANAVKPCFELIKKYNVYLKIVNERRTRHGDYRRLPNGQHQITVNAGSNPYRFFITLIHEIAHLVAFEKFGWNIKPHGQEWKYTFQQLMVPFVSPEIFPVRLLQVVARHFKNPTASSDTDAHLSLALKEYDDVSEKIHIFELPYGATFRTIDGRVFQKGKQRIKRFECVEISTGRRFVFQPHAEVEAIRINQN
ncbi:MAG: sprT domain-containing protein [Capnocytophaga sp.]|nr:sprT domain-containing protein [Capnocytophaga sp.]